MDCSTTGTALDRVLASAAGIQQGDNGRAAMKAFGSFVGGTAATGGVANEIMGSVMSAGPMETLSTGMMGIHIEEGPNTSHHVDNHSAGLNMQNHSVHHLNQHVSPQHMHPQMHPQMMMQQQMQNQMMMQHQMQMQMTAMIQHQKAQIAAQQATVAPSHEQMYHESEIIEDDVVTCSEEDTMYNEGIADHASIEQLAQAWRDAEQEYSAEFDDYDVSNMGGLYDASHTEATKVEAQATTSHSVADPQYEFSPQSQNYGCITTPTTDIAPQQLNFPDNLYERGLEHFQAGEVASAILCFESTLRNIDPEHADAWKMLGKCHTENDADQKAITCWLKSLERDPYSSETLLALVVAYVNELDWEKAVETLKMWVANHPLYAGMETSTASAEDDLYGSADLDEVEGGIRRMDHSTMIEMRDVERLLLSALDFNKDDDAAADVYEALGVVYNVSRDYDAAVDSLRRAIQVRPDDYQLRNKLGATLANSNRSEEALPEYHAALKLKPKYTRGWLNMAISHSNLRNYSQAARCYLQTLSLNPEAKHVWSYLRIALTCDEKWDLLPLAASQNLSAFHDHFDFVDY